MNKIIVANWKMNKDVKEAIFSIKELKKLIKDEKTVEVIICPPFTALQAVSQELKGCSIKLGAQNMYFEEYGAYTGEISAYMLKQIGCEYVILGHSDRRETFGEDNSLINKKIIAALKHSLKPILCIGENLEQRKNLSANEIIKNQLNSCLKDINKDQISKIILA